MQGNRYDRGWTQGRRYGSEFNGRQGPVHGRGYDAGVRGGYDRGWTQEMAYGRQPALGMMNGPGMFTPFGWDPMLRWAGWAPLAGFVPYQDSPRGGSYGPAQATRRYGHDDYRGSTAHGYGGDYGRADYPGQQRMPPRQSPLYGQGGDRALREWARSRGYDVGYTIQPRLGPRR
jgi:hypothetical protein